MRNFANFKSSVAYFITTLFNEGLNTLLLLTDKLVALLLVLALYNVSYLELALQSCTLFFLRGRRRGCTYYYIVK
jgi:hypothetical protein